MSATKLFNIRITPDNHAKFKRFAADNNVTMGAILNNYIEALLDGEQRMINMTPGRKQAKWTDPLDAIRDQYTPGEDF